MSTAKFNTWLNPDGTENYKCRAWVNFNGTGTVAIRASGNVSSITDNGTGDYTVNFTTAMPDSNYSLGGICNHDGGGWGQVEINGTNAAAVMNTTSIRIRTIGYADFFDPLFVTVNIFR